MVQWLGLGAFTVEDLGLILGWRTKIPQTVLPGQKKKNYSPRPHQNNNKNLNKLWFFHQKVYMVIGTFFFLIFLKFKWLYYMPKWNKYLQEISIGTNGDGIIEDRETEMS